MIYKTINMTLCLTLYKRLYDTIDLMLYMMLCRMCFFLTIYVTNQKQDQTKNIGSTWDCFKAEIYLLPKKYELSKCLDVEKLIPKYRNVFFVPVWCMAQC